MCRVWWSYRTTGLSKQGHPYKVCLKRPWVNFPNITASKPLVCYPCTDRETDEEWKEMNERKAREKLYTNCGNMLDDDDFLSCFGATGGGDTANHSIEKVGEVLTLYRQPLGKVINLIFYLALLGEKNWFFLRLSTQISNPRHTPIQYFDVRKNGFLDQHRAHQQRIREQVVQRIWLHWRCDAKVRPKEKA